MSRFKGIAMNFLLASMAPILAATISFIILVVIKKDPLEAIKLFIDYPWRILFAVGILSSIWVQFTLSFYFDDKEYEESTKLPPAFRKMNDYINLFMIGSIILALVGIEAYYVHIGATLFYLLLVSAYDASVWLSSKPVVGEEAKHLRFKECCRQLLFHVDGVVFFIVLFWVLIISFGLKGEQSSFSFSSEVIQFVTSFSGAAANNLHKLSKHELREPLMAGVIGFHAILSVALLGVHLVEWENAGASPKVGAVD